MGQSPRSRDLRLGAEHRGSSWCHPVLCSASIRVPAALLSPWEGGGPGWVCLGAGMVVGIYLPQEPSPLVECPAALILDVAAGQLALCHPAVLCPAQ